MSKESHSPSGHVNITSLTLWARFTRFRFVTPYSSPWPDNASLDHLLVWARGLRAARFPIPHQVSPFMVGDRAVTPASVKVAVLDDYQEVCLRYGAWEELGDVGRRHRVQ